jgi:hypothetical protein
MPRQVTKIDWTLQTHVEHRDNIRYLGEPHLTTQGLDQKRIKDWSGTQNQSWSDPYHQPQKTKFPYYIKTVKRNRASYDDSGGSWYFPEELIFSYAGNSNYATGWTGGKILMTKYEARKMGLSDSEVIKNYRQDETFDKSAKLYGFKPTFFFNYRKDGSIESLYVPPPPPPPIIKYIEVPTPPPPDKIEAPPEPVFEVSKPEPVAEEQRVVKVSKPEPVVASSDNTQWILLAIVGLGILMAIIFTLRGRQNA